MKKDKLNRVFNHSIKASLTLVLVAAFSTNQALANSLGGSFNQALANELGRAVNQAQANQRGGSSGQVRANQRGGSSNQANELSGSFYQTQANQQNGTLKVGEWRPLGKGFMGRPNEINFDMVQNYLENGISSIAQNAFANNAVAIWLRTEEEGLHRISVPDLAASMGVDIGYMQSVVESGGLRLSYLNKRLRWHYDEDAYGGKGGVIFPAFKYDTIHTQQNAYHVRILNKQNHTMKVVGGNNINAQGGNVNGSQTPFMDTLTFEEEIKQMFYLDVLRNPGDEDKDYWYYAFFSPSYPGGANPAADFRTTGLSLDIPNPDIYNSSDAQIRITLRGGTDLDSGKTPNLNDHKIQFSINGNLLGVAEWDGFTEFVFTQSIPHGWLTDGDNRLHMLRLDPENGQPSNQRLDKIEIDYVRLPVAVDDQLWLHDAVKGAQVVTGFSSSNILVIENPDRNSPKILSNPRIEAAVSGGFKVTFNAKEGRDYLVVDPDKAHDVVAVDVDIPSTLTRRQNRVDYMIIAPRAFANTANALADYRQSRFPHAKIIWLDDIYDVFAYGRVDPYAITRFMDFVDRKWKMKPDNVVILGNGTLDHKSRLGMSDSYVPIVNAVTPWGIAPSDVRLLTGGVDPKFAFGRIPIWTEQEGHVYLAKLQAQESVINTRTNASLIADNPDDAGDFHGNMDALAANLIDNFNFTDVLALYHDHPDPACSDGKNCSQSLMDLQKDFDSKNLADPTTTLSNVTSMIRNSATWEAKMVTYDGHGSSYGLGSENYLLLDSAAALDVSYPQPVFTALSCSVADFARPGSHSIADNLLLGTVDANGSDGVDTSTKGAAAVVLGATGLSLDVDAQKLNNIILDSLYGGNNTVGEAMRQAIIHADVNDFMRYIYTVIGDPAVYLM